MRSLLIDAQDNPAVSVVMATRNRASFLERSISSFLNQTYDRAELLIVDDGSSDDSFQIVRQFIARSNGRIRYFYHAHRGLAASRNVGIVAAAGQFIAFLDSDDAYDQDYLEVRYMFMKANPEVDLIRSPAKIVGNPFVRDRHDPSKNIHLDHCHIGGTFFGKKTVFLQGGGFDPAVHYSEDAEFWFEAEKKFTCREIPQRGYIYYRDTPDSICNQVS